jgi:hypothetical protein
MSIHHPNPQALAIEVINRSRGRITINAAIHIQTTPEHDGYHLLYPPSDPTMPSMTECASCPVLTAHVKAHDLNGYGAIFGWIQLVRSTDDEDIWKMDPIPVLSGLDTPFAYLGIEPTLFDAPMREMKDSKDVDWTAHAFLCTMGRCLLERRVSVVAGFEWGWEIRFKDGKGKGKDEERTILVKELKNIEFEKAWTEKLDVLKKAHVGWVFEDV